MVKASSLSVLKNLEDVSDSVIPMYEQAAKQFLDSCSGNSIKALSKTLAYISGNYKGVGAGKSMLTGQEQMITLQMNS